MTEFILEERDIRLGRNQVIERFQQKKKFESANILEKNKERLLKIQNS